jgi:hypothetical protein
MESFEVTPYTPFEDLKVWLSVPEYAKYVGLTPYTVYQQVKNPKEPLFNVAQRFGKKIRIPKEYVNPNRAAKAVTP